MMKLEAPKDMPEVSGIFVGGCVERGEGSSFRAKAHAHIKGDYAGWICYRSIKRLKDLDITYNAGGDFEGQINNSNELLIHEYCHIKGRCGHTAKFRKLMQEYGYDGDRYI